MARDRHLEPKLSWAEVEARILAQIGAWVEEWRNRTRIRYPFLDLAWQAVRLVRKARLDGITTLHPRDQEWIRMVRQACSEPEGLDRIFQPSRKEDSE